MPPYYQHTFHPIRQQTPRSSTKYPVISFPVITWNKIISQRKRKDMPTFDKLPSGLIINVYNLVLCLFLTTDEIKNSKNTMNRPIIMSMNSDSGVNVSLDKSIIIPFRDYRTNLFAYY